MIRLRILGGQDLLNSEGEVILSILSQPKRLALLAYLALHASGTFTRRDKLLALFWPESEPDKARAALRKSLSYLRQGIGEGVLVTRGDDEVGIAAGVLECDAVEFSAQVDRGDLRSAWAMYRGPFLDGVFIAGSPNADQWIEEERRRLERRAVDVAASLADDAARRGDLAAAIGLARDALDLDPYHEGTLRRLMGLLIEAGEPERAIRSYEDFAARLTGVELEPSAETRALLGSIRDRRDTVAAVTSTERTPVPRSPHSRVASEEVGRPLGRRTRAGVWRWIAPASMGVAVVVSFVAIRLAGGDDPRGVTQVNISLPDSVPLVFVGEAALRVGLPSLALSPDGGQLAFVGRSGQGTRLYVRSMANGRLTPVEGTAHAFGPFYSPDGAWIGFFAGGHLMRVSSDGAQVQPLLEADAPLGGTWAEDGRIAAVINDGGPLAIIPPGGGDPRVFAPKGTLIAHPFWIPGTEWVLLTCYDPKHICAMSTTGVLRHLTLDGDAVTRIEGARLVPGSNPRFLAPGYLLYSAPFRNALLGVHLDPSSLTVRGEPEVVYDGVRREAFMGSTQASVAANGDLILARGTNADQSRFVWVDRDGTIDTLPLPPRVYGAFYLAPDGRRLAAIVYPRVGETELWIMDLERGGEGERWDYEGLAANHDILGTAWLPSSDGLLATLGDPNMVLEIDAERPSGARVLWSGAERAGVLAATRDGRVVFRADGAHGSVVSLIDLQDIARLPPRPSEVLTPLLPTFTGRTSVAVSPDGAWVAYHAEEAGTYRVFAVPLEGHRPPIRVSSSVGEMPRWSPRGDGLYYRYGRKFFWTPFTASDSTHFGTQALFLEGDFLNVNGPDLAISRDGARLLLLQSRGGDEASTLDVTLNFRARLVRLLDPA